VTRIFGKSSIGRFFRQAFAEISFSAEVNCRIAPNSGETATTLCMTQVLAEAGTRQFGRHECRRETALRALLVVLTGISDAWSTNGPEIALSMGAEFPRTNPTTVFGV
jgi:hypothetical protein